MLSPLIASDQLRLALRVRVPLTAQALILWNRADASDKRVLLRLVWAELTFFRRDKKSDAFF
jgi:hypothetical protein